jgi:hypothetical protein
VVGYLLRRTGDLEVVIGPTAGRSRPRFSRHAATAWRVAVD